MRRQQSKCLASGHRKSCGLLTGGQKPRESLLRRCWQLRLTFPSICFLREPPGEEEGRQARRRERRRKKKERLPEGRRHCPEDGGGPSGSGLGLDVPVIAQRRGPAVQGVEPRRDATGAVQDVSRNHVFSSVEMLSAEGYEAWPRGESGRTWVG